MRTLISICLLITLTGALTACTSSKQSYEAALVPMPADPIDPPDSAVKTAIADFLGETKAPKASKYAFSRIDLNDDGRRDALVLFQNPYGYWCGMHGCTMLVLKADDDSFTLVNGVQPVREPVYISEDKNKGWKDMIIRVSGRWSKAKDVALQFDGRKYPNNPSDLPPLTRLASNEEARLFMD